MKKILFLLLSLSLFTAVQAQSTDGLELKETEFNFGKIPQGKPVYHFFELVNKSDKPIKLDNVQASCGCTTPEWSQEPIVPGATTKIKVGYNAASEGVFDKFITVTYNGGETRQFRIKGEVWKAPAGAAPANASLQFLKKQIQ